MTTRVSNPGDVNAPKKKPGRHGVGETGSLEGVCGGGGEGRVTGRTNRGAACDRAALTEGDRGRGRAHRFLLMPADREGSPPVAPHQGSEARTKPK